MTDQEINEAIAVSAGWRPAKFTEDLSEINDVCRANWNHLSGWSMEMRRIVCRDDKDKEIDGERLSDLWFYCATARQRCEGYLRAIGKWRES